MKKALFAGAAVFTLTTASTAIAITKEPQSLKEVKETADAAGLSQEFEEIKKETNAYLAVTNEQLDAYEQALREAMEASYKTDLRLTAKHITFSSRLAMQDHRLLYASRSVGSPAGNAYSLHLLTPSAITAYELNQFLQGTAMQGLGEAFVNAELQTGVNAMFLTSLAIHESAWGNSRIARDKNNMFGYGAYDRSPYESAVHFGSKQEGIIFVANKLKQNYLLQSGKFHSGSTLPGVNVRYSTDQGWSSKIASTMNQIEKKVMSLQDTSYEVTQ